MIYFLNKNVDIKFSVNNTLILNHLHQVHSLSLKVKRLENQIIFKIFGSNRTKGPKHDSQKQLMLPMPKPTNYFFLFVCKNTMYTVLCFERN
jgi:hypothetical protein